MHSQAPCAAHTLTAGAGAPVLLQSAVCYDYRAQAAETCRSRAQNATCWDAAKLGYCSFTDTLLNKFNINSTQVRLLSGVSNTGRLPEAIPPHMRSKTAML